MLHLMLLGGNFLSEAPRDSPRAMLTGTVMQLAVTGLCAVGMGVLTSYLVALQKHGLFHNVSLTLSFLFLHFLVLLLPTETLNLDQN